MHENLSEHELQIIGDCLREAAFGDVFPDSEFQTLFGVWRDEARRIATEWPTVDWSNRHVQAMIIGSMNLLLGYPHRKHREWDRHFSIPREVIKELLKKVKGGL